MSFHNTLTIVIAVFFLAISLGLCFAAVRGAIKQNAIMERRLEKASENGGADQKSADFAQTRNVFFRLGSNLSLPNAEEISRLRSELALSGYYESHAVKSFLGAQVICIFISLTLCLVMSGYFAAKFGTFFAIMTGIGLVIAGLLAPSFFLKWKANKRTDQCRKGFPDMMDLMTACVEAGLGMDAALIRVSNEIRGRYPPIKQNLDIMNLELRAGRDRNEAMLSFANRINLDEAKALAVMLKQAEEMGSSVGQALRTFSDEMRHTRMMRAEEKAAALSAKLTVPLILFIFPTIMVMVMLPAGVRIMEGF